MTDKPDGPESGQVNEVESYVSSSPVKQTASTAVAPPLVVVSFPLAKVRRFGLLVLLALMLPPISIVVWRHARGSALIEAEQMVGQGFGALAAERLEFWKNRFTNDARECAVLMRAYVLAGLDYQARWAAEACRYNKIELAETNYAIGRHYERTGDLAGALSAYEYSARKFKYEPALLAAFEVHLRLGQLNQAELLIEDGVRNIAQNQQLRLRAIKFYMEQKKFEIAAEHAEIVLKMLGTESPPNGSDSKKTEPDIVSLRPLLDALAAGGRAKVRDKFLSQLPRNNKK